MGTTSRSGCTNWACASRWGRRRADLLRLVVRQGMRLTTMGVALGAAIAFAAGGQVQPLLFETEARDVRVYAVVVAVLLLAAFVATLVPALRASRADPNVALRAD